MGWSKRFYGFKFKAFNATSLDQLLSEFQLPCLTVDEDPSLPVPVSSKILVKKFGQIFLQVSRNQPKSSIMLSPRAGNALLRAKKVLYETVRNNFTKKWKRFSEKWNIEVPFTFICKLQTVPSTAIVKSMNCELFIFYYNCNSKYWREKCHKSCKKKLCTLTR